MKRLRTEPEALWRAAAAEMVEVQEEIAKAERARATAPDRMTKP